MNRAVGKSETVCYVRHYETTMFFATVKAPLQKAPLPGNARVAGSPEYRPQHVGLFATDAGLDAWMYHYALHWRSSLQWLL